jgi:hypothetical protein
MHKNIGFTAVAAMLAFAMIFAAKWSIVATTDGLAYPAVGLSPLVASSAYLPIHTLDEAY